MKAEERHKLETNVLADWLGQTFAEVKPYANWIIVGVVAVLVIAGVAIGWPRYRERASATAWDAFYNALATDNYVEFERIAEDYPGTPVAHWGLVVAADARLAQACMQLFSDKASAAQELRRAIDAYTTVLNETRHPDLRQRALFGRARAYEAVSGSRQGEGEIPKAIADYEQLVENWPTGSYSGLAAEQLKRLKSQETKVFYDKFAAFSPARPVSKEPESGQKTLPFDPSRLPDSSPSEFSKLLNLDDLKVKGAKSEQKQEASKAEPAKTEPAKTEPPKTEPPKTEPPKTEPSKTEPSKTEPSKTEPSKTEPSKAVPSKAVPPKAEVLKEVPKVDPANAAAPPSAPDKGDPAKK